MSAIRFKKTKLAILFVGLICAGTGFYHYMPNSNQKAVHIESQYHCSPATDLSSQLINTTTPIYNKPQKDQSRPTGKYLKNNRGLVQPNQIAVAKHKPTYIQVSRNDRSIGWVNASALSEPSSYKLNYIYYSQFWPSPAPDACEIASLKTAMSVKGKGLNIPLETMIQSIPRTNNPNYGYTHDPYKYGSHATINPKGMVKVARKYGAKAKDISGASKQQLIYEIKRGNPLVCEAPYMALKPSSDHDVAIVGYKDGYFLVVDPFARTTMSIKNTWVSTSKFMKEFNAPFRQQHALVIE